MAGFRDLDEKDQLTIIRHGQSSFRILVAGVHWYNSSTKRMADFLPWRSAEPDSPDRFMSMVIDCSEKISRTNMDCVEAALLNVMLVFATGDFFCTVTLWTIEKRLHCL